MAQATAIQDLAIIDVDAHISEPHDLWTSRAPAAMCPPKSGGVSRLGRSSLLGVWTDFFF